MQNQERNQNQEMEEEITKNNEENPEKIGLSREPVILDENAQIQVPHEQLKNQTQLMNENVKYEVSSYVSYNGQIQQQSEVDLSKIPANTETELKIVPGNTPDVQPPVQNNEEGHPQEDHNTTHRNWKKKFQTLVIVMELLVGGSLVFPLVSSFIVGLFSFIFPLSTPEFYLTMSYIYVAVLLILDIIQLIFITSTLFLSWYLSLRMSNFLKMEFCQLYRYLNIRPEPRTMDQWMKDSIAPNRVVRLGFVYVRSTFFLAFIIWVCFCVLEVAKIVLLVLNNELGILILESSLIHSIIQMVSYFLGFIYIVVSIFKLAHLILFCGMGSMCCEKVLEVSKLDSEEEKKNVKDNCLKMIGNDITCIGFANGIGMISLVASCCCLN